MFIGHIFPREVHYPHSYDWNKTFIKLSNKRENFIDIEEVENKPSETRAIDLLTQLDAFVSAVYQPYFNKCVINLKCLNASEVNQTRTFNHLKDANQVIHQIASRITLGYENAYLNPSRVGLCKRIQDAIYLLFGWKTERDQIHKLHIHICKTLHRVSEGVFPESKELHRRNAECLKSLIKEFGET